LTRSWSTPLAAHRRPDARAEYEVQTAFQLGWSTVSNGELLARAEARFDALVTTDRNLQKQQNLAGRHLAILVALGSLAPGQYLETAS
jgi:hypothetical protein